MAEAYVGEIRIFAGNFAPRDWALCNGQLLSIAQNTALFSILGTQYGGDGRVTFALPNMSGAAPMHQGAGAGLTPRTVGEKVGADSVTLDMSQIPAHTHTPQAVAAMGNTSNPANALWAETPGQGRPAPVQDPLYDTAANVQMSPTILPVTGGSQPHNNMQPALAINFIICMYGIFPPRS